LAPIACEARVHNALLSPKYAPIPMSSTKIFPRPTPSSIDMLLNLAAMNILTISYANAKKQNTAAGNPIAEICLYISKELGSSST